MVVLLLVNENKKPRKPTLWACRGVVTRGSTLLCSLGGKETNIPANFQLAAGKAVFPSKLLPRSQHRAALCKKDLHGTHLPSVYLLYSISLRFLFCKRFVWYFLVFWLNMFFHYIEITVKTVKTVGKNAAMRNAQCSMFNVGGNAKAFLY
ncbi:MAG: hypothetical protein FWF10_10960 [Clostridiales bacterium]|nr:hypothetical protein [Clostridiales bacterium]